MNRSPAPLYRAAMRAASLGLGVNLALGTVKLTAGMVAQSFALLSDAVNSLGDSLTSVVVLFALWIAQKPPDEEHPYGHTRAEAVAASNIALLVLLSALGIGWQALQRFSTPHEVPAVWTLWIAGGNAVIKEALYRYKVRVGRRIGSLAIVAIAWDHRSDALCSLAVLIGLAVVRWGGPQLIWADEAAALVVVAAVAWSSVSLFRNSVNELLDVQADAEFVREVRRAAEQVPGACAVEKLRVRKTGLEHLADMHIEVDAHMTVEAGHELGHEVKDRLLNQFASLRDVLIHLEPHPHADET